MGEVSGLVAHLSGFRIRDERQFTSLMAMALSFLIAKLHATAGLCGGKTERLGLMWKRYGMFFGPRDNLTENRRLKHGFDPSEQAVKLRFTRRRQSCGNYTLARLLFPLRDVCT